ncbi:MAG: hypothetical protein COA99_02905 [Moraxellaceae bacterium]|nr:MAG: hypothetical protein COA99_02905 [Moraxellaceae bacterium]
MAQGTGRMIDVVPKKRRKKLSKNRSLLWLLLLVGTVANANPSPAHQQILVSIKPIKLLVELLNDPLRQHSIDIEVSTLLPQGSTPHDYVLKPSDISKVLKADLLVWMGPVVEPYLTPIVARVDKAKVIDVSQLQGLLRLPVRPLLEMAGKASGQHDDDHHQGHSQTHNHQGMAFDPHVWWSLSNARLIAEEVMSYLASDVIPQDNNRLDAVFLPMNDLLAKKRNQAKTQQPSFMLFHDGLHYVEEDLGVTSVARVALGDELRTGIKTLLALKQRVLDAKVVCVVAEPNTNVDILGKIEGESPLRVERVDSLGWDVESYQDMLSHVYEVLLGCRI